MQDDNKPRPRISNYITVEGEKRLREELDLLWRFERPLNGTIICNDLSSDI